MDESHSIGSPSDESMQSFSWLTFAMASAMPVPRPRCKSQARWPGTGSTASVAVPGQLKT